MSKRFNNRGEPRGSGASRSRTGLLAGLGQMVFYLFVLACSLVALVVLVFDLVTRIDNDYSIK